MLSFICQVIVLFLSDRLTRPASNAMIKGNGCRSASCPYNPLPQAIDADVIRARRSKRWRNEYMTYEMEIHLATLRAEEKGLEKGLKKGFEKGRKEEREEVIEKLMKKLSLPREKVEEMLQ